MDRVAARPARAANATISAAAPQIILDLFKALSRNPLGQGVTQVGAALVQGMVQRHRG
jgi:hypothetical protein